MFDRSVFLCGFLCRHMEGSGIALTQLDALRKDRDVSLVAPAASPARSVPHPLPMKSPLRLFPCLALATAGLLLCGPDRLVAAEPAKPKASPVRAVDPVAVGLLKKMSATLGAAKAFTYDSRTMLEVPSPTGQFITLFSEANIAVKRPNKIRAILRGEAPQFDFFYDGSEVAAYAPGTRTYSVLKAPPTIDEMLPELQTETGIRFASAPLLFSDPFGVLTRNLKSAIVVGPAVVNGVPSEHLALRSPGVNWEIWISNGDRALPTRLAVTFTDRPNFPRVHIEFFRWNLRPWLSDSAFEFRKPSDAKEIPFRAVWKSASR